MTKDAFLKYFYFLEKYSEIKFSISFHYRFNRKYPYFCSRFIIYNVYIYLKDFFNFRNLFVFIHVKLNCLRWKSTPLNNKPPPARSLDLHSHSALFDDRLTGFTFRQAKKLIDFSSCIFNRTILLSKVLKLKLTYAIRLWTLQCSFINNQVNTKHYPRSSQIYQ